MIEWKEIQGHEKYMVSNAGEIYSKKSNMLMKQWKNSMGYMRVCIDGKFYFAHRLVASAFVAGDGEMVNHKDFNPLNNKAENLEWTDRAGNMKYSADRGRFKHTKEWSKKIGEGLKESIGTPVRSIAENGEVKYYEYAKLVKEDGHLPSMVCRCCKNERKTHHGLHWEYV